MNANKKIFAMAGFSSSVLARMKNQYKHHSKIHDDLMD